jgi:hypothetical protein
VVLNQSGTVVGFQIGRATPLPDQAGRSHTIAEHKRESLTKLWNHDTRVAPWRGTAYGVIQAVNTWAHHEQTVRAERNMLRAVTGNVDTLDTDTLTTLSKVLDRPILRAA